MKNDKDEYFVYILIVFIYEVPVFQWNFLQEGTVVLGDEKMRIFTRGCHCVFTWKKIKFYRRVPLCLTFTTTWESIQGNHYVFEKYDVKKFEKQGGIICKWGVSVGNRSDA